MKTIWLKTVKIVGYNQKGEPIREEITIKLQEGKNFENFVRHSGNYLSLDIESVWEKGKEIEEKQEFIDKIEEIRNEGKEPVLDLKSENEVLKSRLDKLEKLLESMTSDSEETAKPANSRRKAGK